ncbi:hypothetical protein QQG09_08325 [Melissococcus plutonius]|uniref:hypothetical protein n=1 Tax=Melissococcus plutonius TaxID=33970 RepID=UPI0021E53DFA|nr:hypothetical protein [Melissococcus plutonius]MCV2520384.1 hypothetical protein [Melissococcus plutonius]
MELLKDLELMEVAINDGTATLTFLDAEKGEIREVFFRKNKYDRDKNKFVPDEKQAEQAEAWSQEYFGLKFDDLGKAVGQVKDVYAYDNFNSLWESTVVEKFTKDQTGEIFSTEIKEIEDDGNAIHIRFDYNGKTYQSNMGYSKYDENRKQWFVNPQKKQKQYKKFEEKFYVPIENKDELTGKEIMVEVKVAFGTNTYAEIKKLPKK